MLGTYFLITYCKAFKTVNHSIPKNSALTPNHCAIPEFILTVSTCCTFRFSRGLWDNHSAAINPFSVPVFFLIRHDINPISYQVGQELWAELAELWRWRCWQSPQWQSLLWCQGRLNTWRNPSLHRQQDYQTQDSHSSLVNPVSGAWK